MPLQKKKGGGQLQSLATTLISKLARADYATQHHTEPTCCFLAKWNILVLCMEQHWPFGQLFDSICPSTIEQPLATQLMATGNTK